MLGRHERVEERLYLEDRKLFAYCGMRERTSQAVGTAHAEACNPRDRLPSSKKASKSTSSFLKNILKKIFY